jgi:tetratricopeptide (TPR) repeat protein
MTFVILAAHLPITIERFQHLTGGLADLDRAIQIDPTYPEAYNNRGYLKTSKLQDPQGALTDLDRAIQLKPNDGDAYALRGNRPRAIADLQQAASLYRQQGNNRDYQWAIDLLSKITQGK